MNKITFNAVNGNLDFSEFNVCIIKYNDSLEYCEYDSDSSTFIIIDNNKITLVFEDEYEIWNDFLNSYFLQGHEIVHIGKSEELSIKMSIEIGR